MNVLDTRSIGSSGILQAAAFHLMEQPIEGICSRGPCPVSAINFMAVEQVTAHVRRGGIASGAVETAPILELEFRIEPEEIRRALGSICSRDRLVLVMQVREREPGVPGEFDHVGEGIIRVVPGIVRTDGSHPDADVPERQGFRGEAVANRNNERAVIADEHDQCSVFPRDVTKRNGLAFG